MESTTITGREWSVVSGRWSVNGTGADNREPGSAPRPPTPASEPGLREATRELEGYFVTQLLRAMRRTVPESTLLGGGEGQRLFREMLDEEIARQAASHSTLGLGELLYQQLAQASAEGGSL